MAWYNPLDWFSSSDTPQTQQSTPTTATTTPIKTNVSLSSNILSGTTPKVNPVDLLPSANQMFYGSNPGQVVFSPSTPAVRPASVLTVPQNYLQGASTNPNIQWETQSQKTNTPTYSAPVTTYLGAPEVKRESSIPNPSATTFSAGSGNQPSVSTGYSSAGTMPTQPPSISSYTTTAEEDKTKKKQVEGLTNLEALLRKQFELQTGVTPEKFTPTTTPSELTMGAMASSAAGAAKDLAAKLANPGVKMSLEEMNTLFQDTYTSNYAKLRAANPNIAEPVRPTPEQNTFELQNPDLKPSIDNTRRELRITELESERIEKMRQLKAFDQTLNKLMDDVRNNPEIPISLANRRIEEFKRQYGPQMDGARAELQILNQQIDDANKHLDKAYGIERDERAAARQNLALMLDAGQLGNLTPEYAAQLANQIGMPMSEFSKLKNKVNKAGYKQTFSNEDAQGNWVIMGMKEDGTLEQIFKGAGFAKAATGGQRFKDINIAGKMTRIYTDENGNETNRVVLGEAGGLTKDEKKVQFEQFIAGLKPNEYTEERLYQIANAGGLLKEDAQPMIDAYNALGWFGQSILGKTSK